MVDRLIPLLRLPLDGPQCPGGVLFAAVLIKWFPAEHYGLVIKDSENNAIIPYAELPAGT